MADPIEMLMQDHRKVEELFGRYEQAPDPSVVEQICTELSIHASIEEAVIYPALGAEVEGGQELRDHAVQEHQDVKDAIAEIERVRLISCRSGRADATDHCRRQRTRPGRGNRNLPEDASRHRSKSFEPARRRARNSETGTALDARCGTLNLTHRNHPHDVTAVVPGRRRCARTARSINWSLTSVLVLGAIVYDAVRDRNAV